MPESPTDLWPHFEIATFPEPTGIPHGWDAEVVRKGVPKSLFRRYRAANELTLLEVPNYGPLVCFGTTGLYGRVCQDPRTGTIVEIIYVPTATTNLRAGYIGRPGLINSTLDQFIASAHTVTARFPFDSEGAEAAREAEAEEQEDEWAREDRLDDERTPAVEELIETLHRIDPASVASRDGFWMTFIDDVQMGDFTTSSVLRSHHGTNE